MKTFTEYVNENKFYSDVIEDMKKMIKNIENSEEETPKFRKATIKMLEKLVKDINRGKYSDKTVMFKELQDLHKYIKSSNFTSSGIAWVPGMIVSEFGLYANP